MSREDDLRLLAYSITVHRVRALELGPGYTREHDLGSSAGLLDKCDELLGELRSPAALSRPTLPALHRFATGWGRALLPARWLSEPPRVAIVIPHSILHSLPFHLISTDSGNPLCVVSGFTKCSSLTLFLRCLKRSPSPGSQTRVDPFFPVEGVKSQFLVAGVDALGQSDEEWRRLLVALLTECGLQVEGGEESIEYRSLRDLLAAALARQSYEFAILAAHGYRDPIDAFGSGLLVRENRTGFLAHNVSVLGHQRDASGVEYRVQDLPIRDVPSELKPSLPCEMLTLGELERRAHLVCPLVAILGCSTASPTVYPGDQPLSMTEIILRIGASSVIAPMWDVTVSAVEAWMRRFLVSWRREGRSRAEAARLASRARYEDGAPLHDAGCLVLHGDWR